MREVLRSLLIHRASCFRCLGVEYQRRLDLIHDLRFETATTKIKLTPDDQYVIASGVSSLMAMFSLIYS